MYTSSPAAGTPAGLQLLGVFQSELPPIHWSVAANESAGVAAAAARKINRQLRFPPDKPARNPVPDRRNVDGRMAASSRRAKPISRAGSTAIASDAID